MKPLPKHLRPRWRYIALEVTTWSDVHISRESFQRELWYSGQNLLGDPGGADAVLSVVHYEFEAGMADVLVKVRREETDRARAAIACVHEVEDIDVGIRVLGISGTMRAAEENYLGRHELAVDERNVVFDQDDRVGIIRGDVVTVKLETERVGATKLDLE